MRRATLPRSPPSYASSSSSGTEDSQGGEVGPDPPWSVQQRSHTRHSRERFGTPMAVPPGGYLLARSRRSSPSRPSSPGRIQDVGGPVGTSEGREIVSESLRAENLRLRAQLEQIQEETARLVPTISQELNRLQVRGPYHRATFPHPCARLAGCSGEQRQSENVPHHVAIRARIICVTHVRGGDRETAGASRRTTPS
jgi:hypothetical protein